MARQLMLVEETTTTTGSTDPYVLGGAAANRNTVAEAITLHSDISSADGELVELKCTDGTRYEVFEGYYTLASNTVTREKIIDSSGGPGVAVNWGAGTKTIRSGISGLGTRVLFSGDFDGGGPYTTLNTLNPGTYEEVTDEVIYSPVTSDSRIKINCSASFTVFRNGTTTYGGIIKLQYFDGTSWIEDAVIGKLQQNNATATVISTHMAFSPVYLDSTKKNSNGDYQFRLATTPLILLNTMTMATARLDVMELV